MGEHDGGQGGICVSRASEEIASEAANAGGEEEQVPGVPDGGLDDPELGAACEAPWEEEE